MVLKNTNENEFLRLEFFNKKFIPISVVQEDSRFHPSELISPCILINRDIAERNNLYTQFVSYTVIVNPKKRKFFLGKRIGGESRLINSYCLGFGGHINTSDICASPNIFLKAAIRELNEEVSFSKKNLEYNMLGYVRDMESPTSEHLGAVFILFAGKASIKEKENLEGSWVSYDDLKNKYYEKLESWSRYILDYIYEDPLWSQRLNF